MQKCIIEIPKNSYIKYEMEDNELCVDRVLTTPMPFHLIMDIYQTH